MIPEQSLSSEVVYAPFVGGRSLPVKETRDYENGGVDLSDPSLGLDYQVWRARILGNGTRIVVDAENNPETVLYEGADISEVSLSFDQNMRPVLALVEGGVPKLQWFDSDAGQQVVTEFPGIVTPRVSLDDKRLIQSANSDVIFAYLSNGDLCYRRQRDRYETEYTLESGVPASGIIKIGMNRQWRLQFMLRGTGATVGDASYSLTSVIAAICERAGLPFGKFDTTLLEGVVSGLQISNEGAAYEHIETLAQAHFFDPVKRDGILSFVHRGGDPVLTIDEGHLIGDGADETTRKSPEEIVRVLNLNYYDSGGGLDTDKQTSDRSLDIRGEGEESIDSPLVLTTDFAAQQVIIAHKVMIEEQRGELEITLPDSYLRLTVGDVVLFRGDRLRIDEESLDAGEQKYKLVYDRKSAYQSQAFGLPPVEPPAPVAKVPGATALEFIDVSLLADGDDARLCYYLAISGGNSAWEGADLALSFDGGVSYIDTVTGEVAATMGTLTTALGSHRPEIPDTHNRVQVQISTYGAALESRTLAELLNRQNRALIGDEIVSFGEAEEISPGVWELGYLLRGRRGTPVSTHPAGTRFVLLDRADLECIGSETYNLGQPLTVRATSLGADTETTVTETFTGQAQVERAPAYLRAYRSGGNLVIDWVGVGRTGGRGEYRHGQYFTGYRVDVGGSITDTQATTLTVADPGAVTVSVQQLNSLTGAGPAATIDV